MTLHVKPLSLLVLLCVSLLAASAHAALGRYTMQPLDAFNGALAELEAEQDDFPKAFFPDRPDMRDDANVLTDDGQRFLRITGEKTQIATNVGFPGQVPPTELRFRYRLENFEQGDVGSLPNISIEYLDAGNGTQNVGTAWIAPKPSTDGWVEVKQPIDDKAGRSMRFIINFDGRTGHLDLADMQLAQTGEARSSDAVHPLDDVDPMFGPNDTPRQVDRSRITGADELSEDLPNTIYVDQDHPAASDMNPGTSPDRPKKTIGAALAEFEHVYNEWNGWGTKIVIGPGVYRLTDTLRIDHYRYAARKVNLILEGAADGSTVIAGSITAGYEPQTWELIDAERKIYRHDWPYNWGLVNRGYYTSGNLLSHRRELIALNGELLAPRILDAYDYTDPRGREYNEAGLLISEGKPKGQPGYDYKGFVGAEALQPGEFGVAEIGPGEANWQGHEHPHGNSIFLRLPEGLDTLEGALIEVGYTPTLLRAYDKSNVILRNLTFKHATSWYINYHNSAAVEISYDPNMYRSAITTQISPTNWKIENCHFVDNVANGLRLYGITNFVLRNATFTNNGATGLSLSQARNGIVENVKVTANGRLPRLMGLQSTPHGGAGVTFSGVDILFRECGFDENTGTGFRGDVVATNVIYENCTFNRNAKDGMMHEISWGPILLKDCQLIDNGSHGLLLYNVWDVRVLDSIIAFNDRDQLAFANATGRTTPKTYHAAVARVKPEAPIPTVRDFVLKNSVVASDSEASPLFNYLGGSGDAYQQMVREQITGEGNTYHHPEPTKAFNVGGGRYGEQEQGAAMADLIGWQTTTGTDKDATWQEPALP